PPCRAREIYECDGKPQRPSAAAEKSSTQERIQDAVLRIRKDNTPVRLRPVADDRRAQDRQPSIVENTGPPVHLHQIGVVARCELPDVMQGVVRYEIETDGAGG